MKERVRRQERSEKRLPGEENARGKGPEEEGAGCAQALGRALVYLYTQASSLHTHVSIMPWTLRPAQHPEPTNSAPSAGSSSPSISRSSLQVPCHAPLARPFPPKHQPHLFPPHSGIFRGFPCPGDQDQVLQSALPDTHDSPNEAPARPRQSGQALSPEVPGYWLRKRPLPSGSLP